MPAAISCVTVPVDDLQKSIAFYRDGLGLAPEEQDADHAAFDLDGVYLVLLAASSASMWRRWAIVPPPAAAPKRF